MDAAVHHYHDSVNHLRQVAGDEEVSRTEQGGVCCDPLEPPKNLVLEELGIVRCNNEHVTNIKHILLDCRGLWASVKQQAGSHFVLVAALCGMCTNQENFLLGYEAIIPMIGPLVGCSHGM